MPLKPSRGDMMVKNQPNHQTKFVILTTYSSEDPIYVCLLQKVHSFGLSTEASLPSCRMETQTRRSSLPLESPQAEFVLAYR